MTNWPPIENSNLASRLAMDNDDFAALAVKLARRIEPRELTEAAYVRALAYPWERPQRSFALADGVAMALQGGAPVAAGGEVRRWPLLSFGSNGVPAVLARKLSVLPEGDRDIVVLTGELEGYAIAASAHLALYGALPATIEPASSVRERAAVLMVTAEQFQALTLTEFNYRVVRLSGSPFTPDLELPRPVGILAYVSRWGAFGPDGGSNSQSELLDAAARLTLGGQSGARELVGRVFGDYAWAVEVAAPKLGKAARPFSDAGWEVLSSRRATRTA